MFIDYSDLDHIVIHHDGKTYFGEYHVSNFMVNRDGENNLVFEILSIENKYEFIRNVVGYTPREGTFPYLRTKEDFIKVLDALNKEYDRQFGSTNKIIADKDPNYYNYYCGSEQPLTPSESISNISIKTFIKPKKHYQLNFNN